MHHHATHRCCLAMIWHQRCSFDPLPAHIHQHTATLLAGTAISETEPAAVFDILEVQQASSTASSGTRASHRILQPVASAPAGSSPAGSLFSRTWSMSSSSMASFTGYGRSGSGGLLQGQQLGSAGGSGGLLGSVPGLRRSVSQLSVGSRAGEPPSWSTWKAMAVYSSLAHSAAAAVLTSYLICMLDCLE